MSSDVSSPIVPLAVEIRTTENRGQVRRMRKTGWIPSNVYGGGECVKISVPEVAFLKEMKTRGLYTRVFDLKGVGHALVREMQFPSTKDIPLHINFMRLTKGGRVLLSVPIRLIHEDRSPGIKRGGMANLIQHTITLSVSTQSIPSQVAVDLSGLEIGKTLHLRDINLPEGARAVDLHPDDAIVGVVPPAGLVEELRKDEKEGAGK